MEFATGALGTLLPKLGKLLQDEYNLQKSVKKDIQFLTDEIESTSAALRKIGDVPPEQLDEQVKIWARDVRELSYDMEDVVDTFLVQVQGPDPPSRSSFKRFIRKMKNMFTKGTTHHHIAEEIKEIKERAMQVAARRDRCRVDAINPTTTTLIDPRLTALYTEASDLVGIDEAREQVITRLIEGEKEKRVVSIVGMGGIGKTTLAKAVYDKIKGKFQCTAFVTLSKNPDMKKVFNDILYELNGGKYENIHTTVLDLKQLIDRVKKLLMDQRYLIVIDDIWDTTPWKIFKCALSENKTTSTIIITTRIVDVANHVGGLYELRPLTYENSKILFYRRIFESEDKCPSQFYEVSEKILKKCGGVPLAILTTSSLLAYKLGDINEWHQLCDSIGSGISGIHDLDNMRKILSLSYYDLPSHLKTCLLYLSIFPEDYVFQRNRLIWRWIAEDFVQHGERDQSIFEVGENYLNQLSNRNLIQPSKKCGEGRPQSYCLHDMVLDLICSLSKEGGFVTNTSGNTRMPSSRCNVRRLWLHNNTWPAEGMPKLRSLIMFGGASLFDSVPSLSSSNLLRVLDLAYCNLTNHQGLMFLGDLLHLRYLGLRHTYYAGKLPEELGKLQFLQTLDLKGVGMEKLPTSLVRLRQLMCLCADIDTTKLPSGLRNITSLEMLSGSMDCTFIMEELCHLTQLRKLHVRVLPNEEGRSDQNPGKALLESLGNLQKIKDLHIWADYRVDLEGSVESLGNLHRLLIFTTTFLPTWINPSTLIFLTHLHIAIDRMRRGDIQVLGALPALCFLYLFVNDSTQMKEMLTVSADAFPCTRECIFSVFKIVPSTFPAGAMPRLETFEFSIQLEDTVSGDFEKDLAMDHLPSLRSVCVHVHPARGIAEEVISRVEEMLKHHAAVHPNHPSINIKRESVEDHFVAGLAHCTYIQMDAL